MKEIRIETAARRQMVDVSRQVDRALKELELESGWCRVFVPHTTAAVVVNESADPDVARDLLACYAALVPDVDFQHAEGNSDAHFLSTVLGGEVTLPVEEGALRLGTWQGVFLVELDGPRTRRLWIGPA